jgi:hypothetical protein
MAEPVRIEFKNCTFNASFKDEYADGKVVSSGDLVITAEAETIPAVVEFLQKEVLK